MATKNKDSVSFFRNVYSDCSLGKMTVIAAAKKWKISRRRVYQIIDEIEGGNKARLVIELRKAKLYTLWEYKYSNVFFRVNLKVFALEDMIVAMLKDGFSLREISKLTGVGREKVTATLKLYVRKSRLR